MEPFKNEFSYLNACRIAECVKKHHSKFSIPRFTRGLETALAPLELKPRMRLIADRLEANLPDSPPTVFEILCLTLASDEPNSEGLRGFQVWPLTEIVARRGLNHFDEAMVALREMTRRFTSEFAIRDFLRHHRERTLQQLHLWCSDPDPHVRRLVTEGSRPLLPWGGNLQELLEAPYPTLNFLEKLHQDPSDYVRHSVSNHLNDFSKHHPELVIQILSRWKKQQPNSPQLDKLARHACRTLLKIGHPGALKLHGFHITQALELNACCLGNSAIHLGETLAYQMIIHNASTRSISVMFDYAIHHRKANGNLSPKVFKGRTRQLAPGEQWQIHGRHSFKPVTTRTYHPGVHHFEPRLNGKIFPIHEFTLHP
jgi:3-methyladenine DNA glycosylase AlkC